MNDKIEMISFKEIYKILGLKFKREINSLSPDELINLAKDLELNFKIHKIPYWKAFENAELFYNDSFLFNLIFQTKNRSDDIIILTDECFQNELNYKKAPVVNFTKLLRFIAEDYSNLYQIEGVGVDFFQVSDIIFISRNLGMINIIHHEGYHMEIVI